MLTAMLVLGCQDTGGPDEPTSEPEPTVSATPEDTRIYSGDIYSTEVCPAPEELTTLPTGESFTTAIVELSDRPDDLYNYHSITCTYGIQLNPGFTNVKSDFVYMRIQLGVLKEPNPKSTEAELDEWTTYFGQGEWTASSSENKTGEFYRVCVSEESGGEVGQDEFSFDCEDSILHMPYANAVIYADTRNLEMIFSSTYHTTGEPVDDEDFRTLGAAMTELAQLVTEAIPLVEP
ncbi:hypothetical protein [Glycomyces paridis]|uniref:Uncharacterized protein n=1 Tax=Glycomyces paridis TaxID=2126555 RepID=A0A4S8PJR4_9ACTN|nr:hypothetical protein [Glycomyces paridis]THV30241.1 hypothetical protein E9998_07700 [Glycomyces paridis]